MKHEEEKSVRSLSQICRVNGKKKTIRVAKGSLGLHRLGHLDYLTGYCGWTARWE